MKKFNEEDLTYLDSNTTIGWATIFKQKKLRKNCFLKQHIQGPRHYSSTLPRETFSYSTNQFALFILVNRANDEYFPAKRQKQLDAWSWLERVSFCHEVYG